MRVLIITQVLDTDHPVLGFFHRWVEEFAAQCEVVQVICLQKGNHQLPSNVTVYSLGKEEGVSRIQYLLRFYRLVWQLRHQYDGVFVHMNQEYVLLAGLFWKLLQKKVLLWRNHFAGSWLTNIAGSLSNTVLYTSKASYTATFKNAVQMPIGIDPSTFKPQPAVVREPASVLYVGRVARSKRILELLQAVHQANEAGARLQVTVVGPTTSPADEQYLAELKQYSKQQELLVTFRGPVPWEMLPQIYSAHELSVNLSPPGMFDKVIGESLACMCDVVTTNVDLADVLQGRVLTLLSVEALSSFLQQYTYDAATVDRLRQQVLDQHALPTVVQSVLRRYQQLG